MKCPSCKHEHIAKARFCENCGTALHRDCSLCGNSLSPGAKYCQSCGTLTPYGRQSMPDASSILSGENRQISVVFSDLVDSTRLAQTLDPETYRDVIQAYQQAASQVVDRYQGYIARYLGDGILIYFGFPQAHDDNAERAVNAGKDIVAAVEALNTERQRRGHPELAVRVGIHTGPAVVSEVGDPSNPNVQVLGDTINIASRLQHEAPNNAVVMSRSTLRLVAGQFITEDLGPRQLKGVAEAVQTYRVIQRSGVRSRLEAAVHLTPLIGREAPLEQMLEVWQQTTEGQGSSVLVRAEPGMGKSRLLHAFHERIADTPHSWLECRCSQLDQSTAFQPIVELIRRGLQVAESDSDDTKLERLERGIRNVGGDVEQWVPLLAPLLGLGKAHGYELPAMGVDMRRRQTVETLVQWLLALGRRQSLVVLVEDMHWCDHSTLEVFDRLVCQAHESRLMMLASTRSGHKIKLTCAEALRELNLPPLTGTEVAGMVDLLCQGRMPDAAKALICKRAGGVPLFVEELTRTLLESGAVAQDEQGLQLVQAPETLATTIPASLNDLLMARLDQLGNAKQLAQIGAVIGREFHHLLLAALSDRSEGELQADLQRLIDAELLYRRGSPPEAVYLFKHALIQDAAYQALLRSSRRELHSRIGDALRDLLKRRIISDPGQIARHYEQAERFEDAAHYYKQAAALAETRSAIRETYEISRHAINLLVALPESSERQQQRLDLMISLGRGVIALKGYAHQEAGEVTRMGVKLAQKLGHPLYESLSLTGLCVHYLYRARFNDCEATARRLIENSAHYEMPFFHIVGEYHLGCSRLYQGRFVEAQQNFDQTLALFTPALAKASVQMVGQDLRANALALKVWPAWLLGDTAEAVRMDAQASEEARNGDSQITLCHVLCQTARLRQMQGDYRGMLESAQQALDIAERHSIAVWREVARISTGAARCELGASKTGMADMLTGIKALIKMGTAGLVPFYLGMYANACLKAGRLETCRAALSHALRLAETTGGHVWTAELLRLQGDLAIQSGAGRKQALQYWRQAEAMARQQQAATLAQRIATQLRRIELPQTGDQAGQQSA